MLKITGLRKVFGGLPVLDGVDLRVEDGEIAAVLGPSGCGKTTLLNIIAGFVGYDGGSVEKGGARLGYMFQEDRLLPWLTVERNIRIVGDPKDAAEVDDLIALVGLAGFGKYYPEALSGGMRQRCALARAYHFRCGLLLMDEPFKSLDFGLRRDMLAVLMNIWRSRRNSILCITHEVDEALAIASRIVVLGRRPTRVAAEFTLEPAEAPRDLADSRLMELREKIVARLG